MNPYKLVKGRRYSDNVNIFSYWGCVEMNHKNVYIFFDSRNKEYQFSRSKVISTINEY